MKKIYLSVAVVLSAGLLSLQAQQFNNTALAAQAQSFTEEVELGCPQYINPGHISVNAGMLSRVEITTQTPAPNETYPLLSAIQLRDKCNPNLQRDENNFDPTNFNPLK